MTEPSSWTPDLQARREHVRFQEIQQEQARNKARIKANTITMHHRNLGYFSMAAGLLEDYGLDPRDHPEMVDDLQQSIGEAIIDTLLQVLDDNAGDPRVSKALREARGEDVA